MIPRTIASWQTQSWQESLRNLIEDPKVLFDMLGLDESLLDSARETARVFPLRTTQAYIARIQAGNIEDPLLKQILPMHIESAQHDDFVIDPLDEAEFTVRKGLIHKYHGRVLFIASTQCAINCRYCFRRHFPYQDNQLNRQDWQSAIDYVADNSDIDEVILSGGDPLALPDSQLSWLLDQFETVEHVQRVRVHTRLPIVIPARITDSFLSLWQKSRFAPTFVVHSNHPAEIDGEVGEAFLKLNELGAVFNQSVLLRGVNDNIESLEGLSKKLFQYRVIPYYLHILDRVQGTQHFMISDGEAIALHRKLRERLPGYLLPELVKEEPHAKSKTPITGL